MRAKLWKKKNENSDNRGESNDNNYIMVSVEKWKSE